MTVNVVFIYTSSCRPILCWTMTYRSCHKLYIYSTVHNITPLHFRKYTEKMVPCMCYESSQPKKTNKKKNTGTDRAILWKLTDNKWIYSVRIVLLFLLHVKLEDFSWHVTVATQYRFHCSVSHEFITTVLLNCNKTQQHNICYGIRKKNWHQWWLTSTVKLNFI